MAAQMETRTFASQMTRLGAEMLSRVKRSLVQVRNEPHGAGAGLIWQHDGIIITNHHVVAGGEGYFPVSQRLAVTLADGRTAPAQVLAVHDAVDLAILKIDLQNLPFALVADSHDLRVGELVFAVGHPWGQVGVVTGGIVSALSMVTTRSGKRFPIIRSDALLAPGNSGGPLVNAAGGVVGINTMIVGGDQAFAIPSHLAVDFVNQVCP